MNATVIEEAYNSYLSAFSSELGIALSILAFIIVALMIWSLIWQAIAMYKSARRKQIIWFIIIAITNTIGILPIIYLIIYRKKKNKI